MELSILERLMLLGILPEKGDYVSQRILHRLRIDQLGFKDDEVEKFNIVIADGKVTWNDESGEGVVNIPLGKVARELIVKALEALNDAGEVTPQHLSLFEKFGFDED